MMQSDFAILDRLRETPSEKIDAVDPRLVQLGDLANRGEWKEAEEKALELLEARVFDVRPLSYYFFAGFHRGGLKSLATVLDAVASILGDKFESVGPHKKREHQFDKRLTWLFEKMLETIEYHEHKRSAEWAEWHVGLGPGSLDPALVAGDALAKLLADKSSFEEAPRALGALQAWIRGHAEQLAAPPKKKTQPPPAIEPAAQAKRGPGAVDSDDEAIDALQRRVGLVVSHEFTILVAKLKAFDALVAKDDLEKAAVVADDLNRIIASFDPRAYFPELFSRFTALYSKHVLVLTEQIDQRESPVWKALEQFYKVDPKGFVDGGK